jgi:hypothetical protein
MSQGGHRIHVSKRRGPVTRLATGDLLRPRPAGGPTLFCLLLSGFALALAASETNAQERAGDGEPAEHSAVLEVGGVAAVSQSGGSAHVGGSVAVEKTVIENWLELELGLAVTSGAGERELAASFLFKKPWQLSPKVEFMIGVGSELSHTLQGHGGTAPGLVSVLDFMFWPTKNIGWYVEPAYEIIFRHGSRGSFAVTGGLLIGF